MFGPVPSFGVGQLLLVPQALFLSIPKTETVRVSRKRLPKQVLKEKLKSQEVVERRKELVLCVAYRDFTRRPFLLVLPATTKAG